MAKTKRNRSRIPQLPSCVICWVNSSAPCFGTQCNVHCGIVNNSVFWYNIDFSSLSTTTRIQHRAWVGNRYSNSKKLLKQIYMGIKLCHVIGKNIFSRRSALLLLQLELWYLRKFTRRDLVQTWMVSFYNRIRVHRTPLSDTSEVCCLTLPWLFIADAAFRYYPICLLCMGGRRRSRGTTEAHIASAIRSTPNNILKYLVQVMVDDKSCRRNYFSSN